MNNLDDMLEQTLDLYTDSLNYDEVKELQAEVNKYFEEVLAFWEIDDETLEEDWNRENK